jgi:hypothetical protein
MGSQPISFDEGCAVSVEKDSVSAMIEMYCLTGQSLPGGVLKEFDLNPPESVIVNSVSGTLSFKDLNWPWWKRLLRYFGFLGGLNTAICGFIGCENGNFLAFDFQGNGKPQIIPVYHKLTPGVSMSKLTLNLYADLTMPTDFRIALAFHRVNS